MVAVILLGSLKYENHHFLSSGTCQTYLRRLDSNFICLDCISSKLPFQKLVIGSDCHHFKAMDQNTANDAERYRFYKVTPYPKLYVKDLGLEQLKLWSCCRLRAQGHHSASEVSDLNPGIGSRVSFTQLLTHKDQNPTLSHVQQADAYRMASHGHAAWQRLVAPSGRPDFPIGSEQVSIV